MINNDNECSTDTVTTTSKTITSDESNSTMLPTVNLSDSTGEKQPVQNTDNDLNEIESQDNQLVEAQQEEGGNDDDEFIRITAAHQMLTEAQTYDEQKNYPAALHLYRICVDLLLEELMFTDGTEQSRIYLREKCTAIMDRIDVLKTMLDPLPPPITDEQTTNPPTDELNSLQLS